MKIWHRLGKEADAWNYAQRYKTEFDRYTDKLGNEFSHASDYFLGNYDAVDYIKYISPKN